MFVGIHSHFGHNEPPVFCCDVRDITQPCPLATFSVHARHGLCFATLALGGFLTTAYHSLLWSFTAGFYYERGQL